MTCWSTASAAHRAPRSGRPCSTSRALCAPPKPAARPPTTLNWAPESPERLEEAPTLYREAQDCYRTQRAQHCNSTDEWPLRSIDGEGRTAIG
ncbi:hypothetical protein [Streptomyces sp. NPDC057557]|uniref:hypothetical protein n=1 Tax=Streptomyces sp. NPDC057557 TaxID=3346167 RepID=UPI0036C26A56